MGICVCVYMFDWVLQQIGSGVYTVLVVVVQREDDCGPPRQVAEERSHQKRED